MAISAHQQQQQQTQQQHQFVMAQHHAHQQIGHPGPANNFVQGNGQAVTANYAPSNGHHSAGYPHPSAYAGPGQMQGLNAHSAAHVQQQQQYLQQQQQQQQQMFLHQQHLMRQAALQKQQQHHQNVNGGQYNVAAQHQQQQQLQQSNLAQSLQKLSAANEHTWLHIGSMSETVGELDRAVNAYENALRNNPYSVRALTQLASLCRLREQFPKAIEYFQRILNMDGNNGEVWGALGHCYLMLDDLPKAYNCYQQALMHLPSPKEPKLWYGIGILYDRYGSFDHAEEAFTSVLTMDPQFEKANEIYFRLGIIYKQQGKHEMSMRCFRSILKNPPRPLSETDIQFQIGHVYEFQGEYDKAKESYESVLQSSPNHAKVLRQLGWLYHQTNSFTSQEKAVELLETSIKIEPNDSQSWYLLGRCYMAQKDHTKAYESYQQAVYKDGGNPIFWCSIGVLYYQIGQFRDALDAYTRAIRINPYMNEVWLNLGILYESCNNQLQDAIDAYTRALELDPKNTIISKRLQYLLEQKETGDQSDSASGDAPSPLIAQDINPNNYRHGFPGQQVPPPLTGKPALQQPNDEPSEQTPTGSSSATDLQQQNKKIKTSHLP